MESKVKYNIVKKKKKLSRPKDDPKKEDVIKKVSALFEEKNIKVRREKLGQGLGWKAVSGSCKVNDEQIVFVDRKLEQDDQIVFLILKTKEKNITIPEEILANIPEKLKKIAKVMWYKCKIPKNLIPKPIYYIFTCDILPRRVNIKVF